MYGSTWLLNVAKEEIVVAFHGQSHSRTLAKQKAPLMLAAPLIADLLELPQSVINFTIL
jgi:hypothetical protein